MKGAIIGSTLGLVIGAGAILGVNQIPSVRNSLIFNKATISSNSDLEKENSAQKKQIDNLTSEIETAKAQISEKDKQINLKNEQITTLTSEKQSLEKQLNEVIIERDTYKENLGEDVQFSDIIAGLRVQLQEKTSELETANAELAQLRLDKQSLETRVQELEAKVTELEQIVQGYKDKEAPPEHLSIASFDNNTWYLDGTFSDYYKIENGIVVHNVDEDRGTIQCINGQMYLLMNESGGLAVDLSEDGYTFETEDGQTYSKFYTNTKETVVPTLSDIAGTYSLENETFVFGSDNTFSYTKNEETYNGAYLVSSIKTNIGGNVRITNIIKATLNKGDEVKEELTLEYITNSDYLSFNDTTFKKINGKYDVVDLTTKVYNDCFKVTIRTFSPITLDKDKSYSLRTIACYSSISHTPRVNGSGLSGTRSGYSDYTLSIKYELGDSVTSDTFVFYVSDCFYSSGCFSDFLSFNYVPCDIISFEKVGNPVVDFVDVNTKFGDLYFNLSTYAFPCENVPDYFTGTYNLEDDIILTLDSESATFSKLDTEFTTNSYEILAKTDGYDIFHTITIKYKSNLEEDAEHTLVLEFKNEKVVSCQLDSVDKSITKNS